MMNSYFDKGGLIASIKKEATRLALERIATAPNDGAFVILPDDITLWQLIDCRSKKLHLNVDVAVSEGNGGVPNCLLSGQITIDLAKLKRRQKVFLGNSFSLQMLEDEYSSIKVRSVSYPAYEEGLAQARSIIGHPDTARVVSGILGREVEYNRESVTLAVGDVLYVAQVVGGRLPEGATELPEGVEIVFKEVTVEYYE